MEQITTGIVAIAALLISSTTIGIDETIAQGMPHHSGRQGGMGMMMSGQQSHIVDSDRPELRTIAKNIMQSQSAEIEQMRQWYNTWYRK